jgi:hypothetical protein
VAVPGAWHSLAQGYPEFVKAKEFMKKYLFAFRWVIASLILGFGILSLLMVFGYYVPSGTKVTSEAVSRKGLYTGITILIFLIAIPLVSLTLAIREISTSSRFRKRLVQE